MSTDKTSDTAVLRAVKRRKELQELIKRSMSELEKLETFLNMYRHLASGDPNDNKGTSPPKAPLILGRAGYGETQAVFEQLARAVLLEAGHPMHSSEFIEAFQKRGHPMGGNEVRTAWNRLWKAKDNGVLVNLPRHGYWLADEPLPEGALTIERPKKRNRPTGRSQRSEWEGRPPGRKRILSDADLQRAEALLVEGKSKKQVATELGGVSVSMLHNYFPGGAAAVRKRISETAVEQLTDAQAQAEHTRLATEIKKHNESYYLKDAPNVSDVEYDTLITRLRDIERRYPEFEDVNLDREFGNE